MITIYAKIRNTKGKSSNRNIRKKNELPAVIYGLNKKTISIKLNHNHLINQESKKEFYKELILIIKKKRIKAKIQAIQHHPYKLKLMHIDFLRI